MSVPFKTLSPNLIRVPEVNYFPALVNPLYLPNGTPVVDAGPNQSLLDVLVAQLAGSCSYDGLTYMWEMVSGPGTAVFSDNTSLTPTVTVSVIGDYVFRLTGMNADWSVSDSMTAAFAETSIISADILLVGGGGGGGKFYGGGGAGGTVREFLGLVLQATGTFDITVGDGGLGATIAPNYRGQWGGFSRFDPDYSPGYTAFGGSPGGGGGGPDAGQAEGGSGDGPGGGGSCSSLGQSPGGTSNFGYGSGGGGSYPGGDNVPCGGGGSTNNNGEDAETVPPYKAGNGADGVLSSISGTPTRYGGGGGGGNKTGVAGTGGLGGGADGTNQNAHAPHGTDGLGGGGGGGGPNVSYNGGNGGKGVVKVRILTSVDVFTGGTITYDGLYTIHTFTSSGTLAPL